MSMVQRGSSDENPYGPTAIIPSCLRPPISGTGITHIVPAHRYQIVRYPPSREPASSYLPAGVYQGINASTTRSVSAPRAVPPALFTTLDSEPIASSCLHVPGRVRRTFTTPTRNHALRWPGHAGHWHFLRSSRHRLQYLHLGQSHPSRPSSRCAGDGSHMCQVTLSPPPSRRKMKRRMAQRQPIAFGW